MRPLWERYGNAVDLQRGPELARKHGLRMPGGGRVGDRGLSPRPRGRGQLSELGRDRDEGLEEAGAAAVAARMVEALAAPPKSR